MTVDERIKVLLQNVEDARNILKYDEHSDEQRVICERIIIEHRAIAEGLMSDV